MKIILVKYSTLIFLGVLAACLVNWRCQTDNPDKNRINPVHYSLDQFCMGADLSYINQIEDHGGVYRDSGKAMDPYRIFRNHGANLVRLRLWHHPTWTRGVYGPSGTQFYSDIHDVEISMHRAKDLGMGVDLDFHYSDTWADPGNQKPPAAWNHITDLTVLEDSVYHYTYNVLEYLNSLGLMPEMVQIGNEINCGLLITRPNDSFPDLNSCNGKWENLGKVINAGIRAVRDVSSNAAVKTKILLHIADPKNLQWWFDNITGAGQVSDFDVVGFSYYPLWHTSIPFSRLPDAVRTAVNRYHKKVMILETAYPWTGKNADTYANQFSNQSPLAGYAFTPEGQHKWLTDVTQNLINAGLSGIVYWEPGWITSGMKDLWGTGSSWENCTFFDFDGNTLPSIDYMNQPYTFPQ